MVLPYLCKATSRLGWCEYWLGQESPCFLKALAQVNLYKAVVQGVTLLLAPVSTCHRFRTPIPANGTILVELAEIKAVLLGHRVLLLLGMWSANNGKMDLLFPTLP